MNIGAPLEKYPIRSKEDTLVRRASTMEELIGMPLQRAGLGEVQIQADSPETTVPDKTEKADTKSAIKNKTTSEKSGGSPYETVDMEGPRHKMDHQNPTGENTRKINKLLKLKFENGPKGQMRKNDGIHKQNKGDYSYVADWRAPRRRESSHTEDVDHSDHGHGFCRGGRLPVLQAANQKWKLSRRESMDMYHLMEKVDELHPTLYPFDGEESVRFLSFLVTMRDAFDTLGASEAAAVRCLHIFWAGAQYM